jgi:branched-subunit amino acid aminotransferase/4-amino-4-deoxychorismate lyase
LTWVGGRIVDDHAPAIAVSDRALEHGLGLFETLRTWDGHPTLLNRHLARMTRSAAALGLPLDLDALPDAVAVGRLLQANRMAGDFLLRITLSGGLNDRDGSTVWMRQVPLPPPPREPGAVVVPAAWTLAYDDPLTRHKTLNYWSKRLAFERGKAGGADEVLFATDDGMVWEGSRMTLFFIRGETLVTPDLAGPVLPGIMRALVLERAGAVGLSAREQGVPAGDLDRADEVFLTNAVRGVVPVGRLSGRTLAAPGPWTLRLVHEMNQWLRNAGGTP